MKISNEIQCGNITLVDRQGKISVEKDYPVLDRYLAVISLDY